MSLINASYEELRTSKAKKKFDSVLKFHLTYFDKYNEIVKFFNQNNLKALFGDARIRRAIQMKKKLLSSLFKASSIALTQCSQYIITYI